MTSHQSEALTTVLRLLSEGRRREARSIYDENLRRVRPKESVLLRGLGYAALQLGELSEAAALGERAVRKAPKDADAHLLLGLVRRHQRRLNDAAKCFKRALNWDPRFVQAWNNLALTLEDLGTLGAALEAAEAGLSIAPDDADLLNLKGSILCSMASVDEGIRAYRSCLDLAPDFAPARLNLGQALLQTGRGAEAWQFFAARLDMLRPPPVEAPQWAGEDLSGKSIVVWYEQGLGDTVHFSRFVPRLADTAKRVTLVCQERLVAWLGQLDERVEVVSATYRAFDFQVPLLSLAQHVESPMSPPYLPSLGRPHSAIASAAGLKVGLVHQGNRYHPTDAQRSIDPKKLKSLLGVRGVSFFDLGTEGALGGPAIAAGREIDDLSVLAASIAELDLLITVDTLAAHLAGAMGTPVWTLLARSPDWRWGLEGETTEWYPAMKLFRQPRPGAWEPLLETVQDRLSMQKSLLESGPQARSLGK